MSSDDMPFTVRAELQRRTFFCYSARVFYWGRLDMRGECRRCVQLVIGMNRYGSICGTRRRRNVTPSDLTCIGRIRTNVMKNVCWIGFILIGLSLVSCDFMDGGMCDVAEADMVLIKNDSRDFYMDTHEASRANATSGMAGTGITDACNYAGTKPWTAVTFEDAKYACESAGKRLCTLKEWLEACSAGGEYPYGNTYQATTCNISGALKDTGSLASCKTPAGVFDMSGNAEEWVTDGNAAALVGGSLYSSSPQELSCEESIRRIDAPDELPVTESIGFRCCRDSL